MVHNWKSASLCQAITLIVIALTVSLVCFLPTIEALTFVLVTIYTCRLVYCTSSNQCLLGSKVTNIVRLNNLLYLDSLDHEWFLSLVLNVEAVSLQLSDSCLVRYGELVTRATFRNADLIISNEQVCSTTLLED